MKPMILALALLAAPAAAFAQAETNVLDLVGNEDVPKARVEIGSDNGVPGSQRHLRWKMMSASRR